MAVDLYSFLLGFGLGLAIFASFMLGYRWSKEGERKC